MRENPQSCYSIVNTLQLNVSHDTVWNVLNLDINIEFGSMNKAIELTSIQKTKRLEFSINHYAWNLEWSTVICSDEKKINFDAPDGFKEYWYDLRDERRNLFCRNSGKGRSWHEALLTRSENRACGDPYNASFTKIHSSIRGLSFSVLMLCAGWWIYFYEW